MVNLLPLLGVRGKPAAAGAAPTIVRLYVNAGGASPSNSTLDVEWDQEIFTSTTFTAGVTLEAREPGGTWTTITTYTGAKLTGADVDKIRYTMTGTVDTFQGSHEVRFSYVESSGGLESSGGDPVTDITNFATLTNSASIDIIDALDSYWDLEDVNDAVGANNWTNNNTATFIASKVGNGVDMNDNSNQYLSMANVAALNPGGDLDFTIGGWFRWDETEGDFLFGNWSTGGTADKGWHFWKTTGGAPRFAFSDDGSNATNVQGSTVTAGVWYHLVATRIASTNVIELWQDNVSQDTDSTFASLHTGTQDIQISGYMGTNQDTDGGADECFIAIGKTWSDAEIGDHYNGGSGKSYPFIPT